MRYVSLTGEDRRQMLATIGARRLEELFECIPRRIRLQRELEIPGPLSETEVLRRFERLGKKNASASHLACFLGAGAYNHFVPTIIDSIVSRAEFYTAYTPYQGEVSQGTLQAIFEFQTLICQITGMEVSNASLYDGASALAEAVLMANRINRRTKVALPTSLHPEYRRVLGTYASNLELEFEEIPFTDNASLDLGVLEKRLSSAFSAIVLQSPNFLGSIEDIEAVAKLAHECGALLIVVVTEALSLGLLKPPGELGADLVVGEGQSFGIPLSFGGPYLGFFATRDRFKRQMPGRLVGETVDSHGRRSFVLTLSTREQHIRREKATSNICTNQGLCALMASIFLVTLGKRGLRELAEQNLKKAHYLRQLLGDRLVFRAPAFNEFVVRCPEKPSALNQRLFEEGIIGGLPLGPYFPDREDQMLVCTTEQNTRQQIEQLAAAFKSVAVSS